jgi:RNA polymerase sigma-70 factor, ECF subfamily
VEGGEAPVSTDPFLSSVQPSRRPELPLDRGSVVWDSRRPGLREGRGREGPEQVSVRPETEITVLLRKAAAGDRDAESALFAALYDDLKRQARNMMRGQGERHTLQATSLLHEAYLRVARRPDVEWASRGHFLATASRAMRSVLVDHARSKGRLKRGRGFVRVSLDDVLAPFEDRAGDLLALDEALSRLAEHDAEAARLVELRFFGGLTAAEAARLLGVSVRTSERDWEHARAWLRREMSS